LSTFGLFLTMLKKFTKNIAKNILNEIPLKYNLLLEHNACWDHLNISSTKKCSQIKKRIIVKQNILYLLSILCSKIKINNNGQINRVKLINK